MVCGGNNDAVHLNKNMAARFRVAWWGWLLIALGVVAIVLGVVFVSYREMGPREVDDVHPDIHCSDGIVSDSTWLWIIPLYNNVPISKDRAWCDRMLKSGKKLGMHGVKHTFNEFNVDQTREYIQAGVDEFTRAFGYAPTDFKPPKMAVTPNNLKILKDMGLNIHNRWQQLIHKVYHCEDQGRKNGGRLEFEIET